MIEVLKYRERFGQGALPGQTAPPMPGENLGLNTLNKMRNDISELTRQATERGSIFTHDIHVQDDLSSLEATMAYGLENNTYYSDMFLDRMDLMLVSLEKITAQPTNKKEENKIEVQPVLPTSAVDPEMDVRKRKIEESYSAAPVQTEHLGTIAENTEEEVKVAKHAEALLKQAVDALKAIKELLSPNQKGRRKGSNSTRDIFEEPFFDSINETEYQYDPGSTASFDIDSQYP